MNELRIMIILMSRVRIYDTEHTVNVLYEEEFNQKAQKTSKYEYLHV